MAVDVDLKASGPDFTVSGAVGPFQTQTAICEEVVFPPILPLTQTWQSLLFLSCRSWAPDPWE